MTKFLLLLSILFLFMLPISAQEKTELTQEQAIEIARQECIKANASSKWLDARVRARFIEEKGRWFISFDSQSSILGEHLSVYVFPDGKVECISGI